MIAPGTKGKGRKVRTSHSGFRAIQETATIQVGSGFIRGIPDNPNWEE
jgi:hypothetical protein